MKERRAGPRAAVHEIPDGSLITRSAPPRLAHAGGGGQKGAACVGRSA